MQTLTFPCSIQQAADSLEIPVNAARTIVRGARIPTTRGVLNGNAKMLDRAGYERLQELSAGLRKTAMAG